MAINGRSKSPVTLAPSKAVDLSVKDLDRAVLPASQRNEDANSGTISLWLLMIDVGQCLVRTQAHGRRCRNSDHDQLAGREIPVLFCAHGRTLEGDWAATHSCVRGHVGLSSAWVRWAAITRLEEGNPRRIITHRRFSINIHG